MANTKTVTKEKTEVTYPKRYAVMLYNDDATPMNFVIQLLVEVFNKSLDEAAEITMKVHTHGKSAAGVYTFEIAEQKKHEASLITHHHGHPLKIDLEPV
jgi:ATP-dependent Clp protease adaptor protein ClpS